MSKLSPTPGGEEDMSPNLQHPDDREHPDDRLPPSATYDRAKAIAEDVIREDIKACMKGLAHPNLEWSKAVQLAADFIALVTTRSETAPRGQHLSADLQEALHLLAHMARIISATRKEAFAEWALPNSPYEMVKAVEKFIAKPRSVFAPSAIGKPVPIGEATVPMLDAITEPCRHCGKRPIDTMDFS